MNKLWWRIRRLTCGVPEKDNSGVLADAYYFASELRLWAQEEAEQDG